MTNGQQSRKRGRPSKTAPQTPTTPSTPAISDGDESIPPAEVDPSNPIQTQSAAERLLTDISSLSAARPLLRCALTKSLHATDTPPQTPPSQSSSANHGQRTRRSTDTKLGNTNSKSNGNNGGLLAYDLESLRELLSQGSLKGGPSNLVTQLR